MLFNRNSTPIYMPQISQNLCLCKTCTIIPRITSNGQRQKQLKSSLTDEWINKTWYTETVEYDSGTNALDNIDEP